jgi:hypothetical protein
MSGQIINPFSSDFNPTTSINFSTEHIPIAAYGLIGITSLTLAYVTLIATTKGDKSSASAVSMLPTLPTMSSPFGSTVPEAPTSTQSSIGQSLGSSLGLSPSPSPSPGTSPSPVEAKAIPVNNGPPMAEAVPIPSEKPATGGHGKTLVKRKKNKNKKTKRRKSKH